MKPRTLLWLAVGLGGAAVAALLLAGLTPAASPLPAAQARSPEVLAQEALERELNQTLEKVSIDEIEQLLLSAQ
ncbi:MAG: hypothetical protein HY558_03070 [Euryarchaeota archaeon]|nr:hypothetical protein [Euryarchaeota archaeon]